MATKRKKKKRAKRYEKPLKINGKFSDVMKILASPIENAQVKLV